MVGLGPSHQECNSSDVGGVAHDIPPRKDGLNGTSLNVGTDIGGENPKHSRKGHIMHVKWGV